jgi:hypothetical protein
MKIIVYKDRKKEWRWRLVARNGKIVAESGEGYKRKRSALKTISLIGIAWAGDDVFDDEGKVQLT